MFKIMLKYLTLFSSGIFVTLFCQKVFKNFITYQTDDSRVMLMSLKEKILQFNRACGKLPSAENGLKALVEPSLEGCSAGAFLPLVPLDPWDGELTYIRSGNKAYLLPSKPEGSFVEIKPN